MAHFSECTAVPEDESDERLAQLDFEAWPVGPDTWMPPAASEWAAIASPHLMNVGIAHRLMFKSKAELVEMVGKEDFEMWDRLVRDFIETREWLQGLHEMVEAAESRMMVALANLPMEGDGETMPADELTEPNAREHDPRYS